MYPWYRLTKVFITKSRRTPIGVGDVSILKTRVCLTDIDPFLELNIPVPDWIEAWAKSDEMRPWDSKP
jgi:hypothetical protein